LLFAAGDVVQFTIAGTNIGSLRIRGLSMQVSGAPITPNTFSCVLSGTTYDSTTLPALAQAIIEPGQGGSCSGTYSITTADIEAGVRSLDVTVSGMTAIGDSLDTSQTVVVTPVRRPFLEADVAVELCSNATSAGKVPPLVGGAHNIHGSDSRLVYNISGSPSRIKYMQLYIPHCCKT
jgi:hypothetical protein